MNGETNRISYSVESFFGGMSNDEYLGPQGSVLDAQGVELRRNSGEVTLSGNPFWESSPPLNLAIGTANSGEISAWNKYYTDATNYTFFCGTSNGFVGEALSRTSNYANFDSLPILSIGVIDNVYAYNTFGVQAWKGFMINARGGLYSWTYDPTSVSGGLLNATGVIQKPAHFQFLGSNISATAGATYTFGGNTYTVANTVSSANSIQMTGSVNPTAYTGTLTRATGTGDASISFTGWSASGLHNPSGNYNTVKLGPGAPYIVNNSFLIYGCADLIYVYDITKSPWALATALPLPIDKGFTIKGISKVDSQIVIYTSNEWRRDTTTGWVNTPQTQVGGASGKVYYYSLQGLINAQPPDRTIDWRDLPILGVANRGANDFVVTGTNLRRMLWQNTGAYSRGDAPLFQSTITTSKTADFYFDPQYASNSMTSYGNLVLIPAQDKIYTYGSITNGLPSALVKEFDVAGYTPVSFYVDESGSNSFIYVGLRENAGTPGSYKSFYLRIRANKNASTSDYASTGYITLNPIKKPNIYAKKTPVKCEFSYNLEASTTIQIQMSLDDGAFNTIESVTAGGYGRTVTLLGASYPAFYKAKFKIILSSANNINTPHFCSFRFFYDITEDQTT